MNLIRVSVIENEACDITPMAQFLNSTPPRFEICRSSSPVECRLSIMKREVDIAIFHDTCSCNVFDEIEWIKKNSAETRCIYITGNRDNFVYAYLKGADGLVEEGNSYELMFAIEEILQGKCYCSDENMKLILEKTRHLHSH